MCLGMLANFPQNGHLRANLRSSQTRKVEDGAGECLNLSCFFHYCDKGLFFFSLLYLLLTSEAARKTPITQSKSPSATSPSSHRSSLGPPRHLGLMVKQVSSNIPLPAAEHCQIASLQLLKPQTHPRVALTAFFAGSTS